MSEKPILFSAPMVRTILEGGKTMTRRVVKPQPTGNDKIFEWADGYFYRANVADPRCADLNFFHCPYGQPGDLLWVRETWSESYIDDRNTVIYRADLPNVDNFLGWKPSIFMPRALSRLMLEVVNVCVERVQDISKADIKAEGFDRIQYRGYTSAKIDDPEDFSDAWDAINSKRGYSWASNPWVWVVKFKRYTNGQST